MVNSLSAELATLDFNDTFLDLGHVKESFPGYRFDIKIPGKYPHSPPQRPFRYYIKMSAIFVVIGSRTVA